MSPEVKIINFAIDKYQRLARYIEFTKTTNVISKIADDASILKYNCKFGLWYYDEGLELKHLDSYKDIDFYYNDLFVNYYKLLVLLKDYNQKFSIFKPFNRDKRKKNLLTLRIEKVKNCCKILVDKLKTLELDVLKLEHIKASKINISNPIINSIEKDIKPIEVVEAKKPKIIPQVLADMNAPSVPSDSKISLPTQAVTNKILLNSTFQSEQKEKSILEQIIENKSIEEDSLASFLKMSRTIL